MWLKVYARPKPLEKWVGPLWVGGPVGVDEVGGRWEVRGCGGFWSELRAE